MSDNGIGKHFIWRQQQRYTPFGGVRSGIGPVTETDFGYTGQRDLGNSTELMDYNARFYGPVLARFTQADTIIPNPMNPQSLNRYSYVSNNPLKYIDPSGHRFAAESGGGGCGGYESCEEASEDICNISPELCAPDPETPDPDPETPDPDPETPNIQDPPPGYDPNYDMCDDYYNSIPCGGDGYDDGLELLTDWEIAMRAATLAGVTVTAITAEAALVTIQEAIAIAGCAGGPLLCGAALAFDVGIIFPIEMLVIDFEVSYAIKVGQEVSTRQEQDFEWTIIPGIIDWLFGDD